jgi:hypothetical protein
MSLTRFPERFVPRAPRIAANALAMAALAFACGCASLSDTDATTSAELQPARDRYTACVGAEAEKDAGNPAGAEDIAVAAHARCWSRWDALRRATYVSFAAGARTPEERQLANDKADAELRQLEIETRRGVVDRIVQRTLTKKP